MTSSPDEWVYGENVPSPEDRNLIGIKADWIVRQLPATQKSSILEFGCGEGKYLRLVRSVRPAATLVGVDLRSPHAATDFEFHQISENSRMPFSAGAFDTIISCDVLEHVLNIERSLEEISRVLRHGGLFIGFVPLEGGFGPHSLFRFFDKTIYRDTKDHRHSFTRTQMESWLRSQFEPVSFQYSYHLLGGFLDAAFFASFKVPAIGKRMESFWRGSDNLFYRVTPVIEKPSLISRLTKWANHVAYWESKVLHAVPLGSSGLHFCMRKPLA